MSENNIEQTDQPSTEDISTEVAVPEGAESS